MFPDKVTNDEGRNEYSKEEKETDDALNKYGSSKTKEMNQNDKQGNQNESSEELNKYIINLSINNGTTPTIIDDEADRITISFIHTSEEVSY